jgi:IS5 family transposase
VLRTVNAERTLWESMLPEECLGLSAELAAVDALLDDVRFFEPFRPFFDPGWGRPSIPIETYLRLMFLKFRYKLGYETLCREVADSISWQRFCRIPLGGRVPHPTTLMKITTRCGPAVVDQLNETLVAKAVEARLVKTNRVRVDTTVVEADIAYPTDSGLLTRAVGRIGRLVERIQATGAAARTREVDNTSEVRGRAHSIGVWLRRRTGDAKDEVLGITSEIADLAESTVVDAARVVRNARRYLKGDVRFEDAERFDFHGVARPDGEGIMEVQKRWEGSQMLIYSPDPVVWIGANSSSKGTRCPSGCANETPATRLNRVTLASSCVMRLPTGSPNQQRPSKSWSKVWKGFWMQSSSGFQSQIQKLGAC